MSQIKEDTSDQYSINVENQISVGRQGQGVGINDIFEAMQKNFEERFNSNQKSQIPKLSTERITAESGKQMVPTSRSNRKLKPIYSTLVKKQLSPRNSNSNSDANFNLKSTEQHQNIASNHNQTPNVKVSSNQSGQQSNKSSPYAKIMNRLHHSAITEFYPHQEHQTSIQNLQTQRKHQKINQTYQTLDESPNQQSRSPKVLNYKDLQQKIESALKKNSNYKSFGTSRLNKSNLTSRTFNEFNQLLLSRFEQYQKNREREIQRKKQELEQRKQKQLKFHPQINKKSLQFVQQMGGHQPLQNRYQKILEQKNKKLELYQEQKRQKKQKEYEQFMEEFLKHQKSPQQNTRSYDKFYEEMFKWKQRSIKNAQEKKTLLEENQLKQTNTFHPKINQKSSKIVMNSTKSEKYLPIHQRQIPAQKKFKSKIDQECTFKPKINKRRVK